MPRRMRMWELGRCYHIMMRGVDGRAVFVDDQDRSRFCLLLQEALELHKFRVHAFCLMTNHIHLLLEHLEGSLTNGVHRFSGRYAQYFNRRHKKRGYVFQGRFRSILIEGGLYMRRLIRYIHLNPLEAGLVGHPEQYLWSSHNAYFGHSAFTWLEMDRVLIHFGENRTMAMINLVEFMKDYTDASQDIIKIDQAARCGAYGSEMFMRAFLGNENNSKTLGSHQRRSIEELICVICTRFSVTRERLCSNEKTREVVGARAVLSRAAQLLEAFSLNEVCKALDKHHGTISRLAQRAVKNEALRSITNEVLESLF